MSGEWVPLQASLIERNTFMSVGGFNPLLTGPEDIDLLRRILREKEIAETPNLVAYITMGGEGSTTDYDQHPRSSRWARENSLDATDAYQRMRLSAVSPFWRGRMLRVYLTSVVWNLGHRRFFTMANRLFLSAYTILTAGLFVFSKDFWGAVLKSYASLTFEKGIREVQKAE